MRKNTKFKSFMRKLALLMSVSIALMTGCVAGFADQGTDDNTEREIWLNIYTADICVGDSIRIKGAYNTLEIPESGNFVFSSTNDSVASVDADGNVSAVSVGAAWINVSDGELSSSCSIFVTEPKKAGVKLGVHSIGIARNSSYVLSAELGEEYKGQKIIWSSDDSAIASVNEGVVTGAKNGQTIVRAALESDSNIYDECSVMVGNVNTYSNFSAKVSDNTDTSTLQYVYANPGTNNWEKAMTDGKTDMYRLKDNTAVITSWGMYSGSYYESARVFCAPASGVVDVSLKGENYFSLNPEKPSEKRGSGRLEVILNNTVLKTIELDSFLLTEGENKGKYASTTHYNGGEHHQVGETTGSFGINMSEVFGKLSVNVHKGDKLYLALRKTGESDIIIKNWIGFDFAYNSNKSAESIGVTEDSISLKAGKIFDNFKAELKGNDFGDSKIEYLSGDEAVAKVSKDGIIKGEKAGETRVYAVNREYKLINYADITIDNPDVEIISKPVYNRENQNIVFSVKNNKNEKASLKAAAVLRDKIGRTLLAVETDALEVESEGEKEIEINGIDTKNAAVIDIYLTDIDINRCIYPDRISIP